MPLVGGDTGGDNTSRNEDAKHPGKGVQDVCETCKPLLSSHREAPNSATHQDEHG